MSPDPSDFPMSSPSLSPSFSPVLFAGLLVRALPLGPLNLLLDKAVKQMRRRHRDVFDRMQIIENPSFLVVPDDLPFSFYLKTDAKHPQLQATKKPTSHQVAASIRGPLASLIALLEGKIDGDALFFTRELSFEGDTEAVLALRNAVDGAEINLSRDVEAVLGPFVSLSRPVGRAASRLWKRMNTDLSHCAGTLMENHERRLCGQGKAIETLEQQVRTLTKTNARKKPRTKENTL